MKITLLLPLLLLASCGYGQELGILTSDLYLSGMLDSKRVAWKSETPNVHFNLSTGEFIADLPVDAFQLYESNPDFVEGQEKGQGKHLQFSGSFPASIISENRNEPISVNVELRLQYDGWETSVPFTFKMIALPQKGLSMTGHGSFIHRNLAVAALEGFEPELSLVWIIIGTDQ